MTDLEVAATAIEERFKRILDKHAPIRTYQMRKKYLPYLSATTKDLIRRRKEAKEAAVRFGDTSAEKESMK